MSLAVTTAEPMEPLMVESMADLMVVASDETSAAVKVHLRAENLAAKRAEKRAMSWVGSKVARWVPMRAVH